MARRREDRVVACITCGDVLGIYVEGERVPDMVHECPTHDALDREIDSQLDRLRGK